MPRKSLKLFIINKLIKISFENEIEKIFKDSLSFWIKKNLPDLIKDETALHTKKIFEDKLK